MMNRNRPRDRMNRDMGGRLGFNIGGDGLLGEGPPAGGAGPMMGGNPLGLRDTQLALAQSLLQQQQLVNAGFGGAGADFGSLGALAGGMHFLQQQQQQQMRAPLVGVGGMGGGMRNDRKRSGGQLRRDSDEKRGRRDSWGRGDKDRSHANNSRSGQDRDRNRSSRWESDKDKKKQAEDYDPAEPTEDDDEGSRSKDGSNLYCHVCAVSVYDEESFQRHLNGLKHKARMDSIANVHTMRSSQMNSRMKAEEHLRHIERKGGRDPDYFCKICNNDLAIPWEKHRYSNIHKQRLLQVRKGCGWCKVHDFTNFTEVLEHRETEEHKKNAEIYGKKEDSKDDGSRRRIKDGKESERSKSAEKNVQEEEEEEEDLTIPEFNADVAVGMDYVIPVTGYFCKLCHKFYNKKSARATHCQSMAHYEKFKAATEVKIAAREEKREQERLRKEKEAEEEEEAMDATEDGDENKEEEEDGQTEDKAENEGTDKDEGGDTSHDENKEVIEVMDDEEEDEATLEEEGMEDAGENEDKDANDDDDDEDHLEDQDCSGSVGGDDATLGTIDSSSFLFVTGDVAQAHLDLQEQEAACASDQKKIAADDSMADAVTSELSQTSLNPEEGDDYLDLTAPDETAAVATSTPIVVEETPVEKPTTRGKGTARRGRGRGRAKK